jgi:hypothetical protein
MQQHHGNGSVQRAEDPMAAAWQMHAPLRKPRRNPIALPQQKHMRLICAAAHLLILGMACQWLGPLLCGLHEFPCNSLPKTPALSTAGQALLCG